MFLVPLLKLLLVDESVYKSSVSEESSDESVVFVLTPKEQFCKLTINFLVSTILCVMYRAEL